MSRQLVSRRRLTDFAKQITLVATFIVALNIGAAPCRAQEDASAPRYKVPTRGLRVHGGFTNLVEGDVERVRAGAANETLKPRQALESGDTVATGHTGRTEILLTPGYFLRLGNDARVTLLDLAPGNLKIKILHGSVIVEVSITDTFMFTKRSVYDVITVSTPRDEYALATGGAYRFNVRSDGSSDLKVLKGLAVVSGSSVKNGMFASVLNGKVELAPADRKPDDLFDNWSRDRALNLIQGNKSLKRAKWFKQLQETRADVVAEEQEHIRQSNETRIVSALAGFVVLAESGAMIKRGESAWENLKPGNSVNSGDRVVTPIDCRVDIHPHPDVDLLLDGDTEVSYAETPDGKLSVEVLKGAVVMIPQFEPGSRGQRTIILLARKTQFEVSRDGVYRVNLVPERRPELLVYEGEGRFAGHDIKAPKKIILSDSAPTVTNFNKSEQDSFDVWAEKRSQALLVEGRRHAWQPLGGIWFVVEATAEFTFVPANSEYRSPYGGDYSVMYIKSGGLPLQIPQGRNTRDFPSGRESQPTPDNPTGSKDAPRPRPPL